MNAQNIEKSIHYYEQLRNTVVNCPTGEMGYVAMQALLNLVIVKLTELHQQYKKVVGEDYPWNTQTGKL